MGNADPRIRLPLPPLHCQLTHTQSPTTIQRQSCRSEYLARLADLQEPNLRIDDCRGFLYRVGFVYTAFLYFVVRSR